VCLRATQHAPFMHRRLNFKKGDPGKTVADMRHALFAAGDCPMEGATDDSDDDPNPLPGMAIAPSVLAQGAGALVAQAVSTLENIPEVPHDFPGLGPVLRKAMSMSEPPGFPATWKVEHPGTGELARVAKVAEFPSLVLKVADGRARLWGTPTEPGLTPEQPGWVPDILKKSLHTREVIRFASSGVV
jgi:hypothetical protein